MNTIATLQVDNKGGLTPKPPEVSAGTAPIVFVVDPSGRFGYAANSGNNSVSGYKIGAVDGHLTGFGTFSAKSVVNGIAVHPSGKLLFANHFSSQEVSTYPIDASTGALAAATSNAVTSPLWVAMHPSGKFALIARQTSPDQTLTSYKPDLVNLTLLETGSAATDSSGIVMVAVDPSGSFAYVPNYTNNDVSRFAIDAKGNLSLLEKIAAGASPVFMTIAGRIE